MHCSPKALIRQFETTGKQRSYANICLKVVLCDFVEHYNAKAHKCNKKILYLNNFLFDIYLNVISIRYIQKSDDAVFPVTGKDSHAVSSVQEHALAGYDHTGRFIPYWTRDERGKAVLEPAKDYESTAKGSYYGIPRKIQNEAVIDPYVYTVRGRQLLMTSLVSPIVFENRFSVLPA